MNTISSLRNQALEILKKGIAAADPAQAVKQVIRVNDFHFDLYLDKHDPDKIRQGRWPSVHVIGFGKAACPMVKAAMDLIPSHRLGSKPIAVTNYGNGLVSENFEVLEARHPLPDSAGQRAAIKITRQLKKAQSGELVLVLISGGGSALLPYPITGLNLQEKIATTNLLLASGANINEINTIRKHLSQLKGGQMARLAAPADLHALILSDVLGDDLSSIASGPTVPDNTTFADAIRILKARQIWDQVPAQVRFLLKRGLHKNLPETPKPRDAVFNRTSHILVGSNTVSLMAAKQQAEQLGFISRIFSTQLCQEARVAAEEFAEYAHRLCKEGVSEPTAILAGGETTVTLKGKGNGGRNQEMALAFALAAKKYKISHSWVFLSAGTDGRDGPTDAAGGIVDKGTLLRMKQARVNPVNRLKNNDSYPALKKSEDLIITGPTGTNVADLQILLILPA